jgi:hypothetical protein
VAEKWASADGLLPEHAAVIGERTKDMLGYAYTGQRIWEFPVLRIWRKRNKMSL